MRKMIFRSLLFVGALLSFGLAKAQTVTGTVTDESGPLPGATVAIKGTSTGTTTDFDGNYSLNNVPEEAILVFSFVGYLTQEIPVDGRSMIDVNLITDSAELEEVVLIGYGQTTVKDATGSVSSVTSEDFNKGVISSPEQLIQGKTAGVQITQSSGEPGAGVDIRIRGSSSIRSNNNPLFVVDGVPLSGGETAAGAQDVTGGEGGSSPSSNPLSFLNPNDIESISILKDASATAIYGSRGANGVVIITTKSGNAGGQGKFEFTSNLSVAWPANNYDLLGREAFLDGVEFYGGDRDTQDFDGDTDWQDVITRTSFSHDTNLSYSKNYGKGSIRGTLGYGKQEGIIENSSFERLSGRINWKHRFFDEKLTVGVQASVSQVDDEAPLVTGGGGFRGDLLGIAYSANPTWPNDPDFNPGNLPNPANLLENYQSASETTRALINGSLEYQIIPDLSAKLNLGLDTSESTRKSAISANTYGFTTGILDNGRGGVSDIDINNRLLEATLNYNKDLNNSVLDVLVGYSFQDFGRSGRNISGWGFNTTNLNEMGNALENNANTLENSISGSYQQYGYGTNSDQVFVNRLFPNIATDNFAIPGNLAVRSLFTDTFDYTDELQSYFGRVNYTINERYLFTGTLRVDGSSRFGEDNKYGYFPSGAFAWKLAEEDFIGDQVSTLKVRLGVGVTGNQEGLGYGNYLNRRRFAGAGIGNDGTLNAPGTELVAFRNPDLKWEETTSYNLGIDFGFNDDRFSGSLDFYRKETTDLLLLTESAQPAPQPFVFDNLDATVLNEGIELALEYAIIETDDLYWDASFNISYNKNELQDFDGRLNAGTIYGQGLSNAFAQRLVGGRSLFSYYLREFTGYDDLGNPVFEGGLDNQKFVDKDALPDWNAGLSTSVNYKNWAFSAYFAGQFDFYVYNNTANAFFTAGSIANGRNVTEGVVGTGEGGAAEASVSTRFLEKGDFVRLQNATLSYDFDLNESFFDMVRLSVIGQNLFVLTDYSGLDPEINVQGSSGDLLNSLPTAGIDWTAYPRPTTITLGINAAF